MKGRRMKSKELWQVNRSRKYAHRSEGGVEILSDHQHALCAQGLRNVVSATFHEAQCGMKARYKRRHSRSAQL